MFVVSVKLGGADEKTLEIKSERQENQIREIQEKIERIKGEIIKIQTSAQSQAQAPPAGASAMAA